MRGSPLIRVFLLTLALLVTGVGLAWLTSAKNAAQPLAVQVEVPKTLSVLSVPYQLQLSSEAAEIELDTGVSKVTSTSGTLRFDAENPHVAISIRWKKPPVEEQRFAKLTLEAAGKPTFTHVFDSAGDIDDLLELPLSP